MLSNELMKKVFDKLWDKVLLSELSVGNASDWPGLSVMSLGFCWKMWNFVPPNSQTCTEESDFVKVVLG